MSTNHVPSPWANGGIDSVRPCLRLIASVAVLLASGCQSINLDVPSSWAKTKAAPLPEKIVAVWTEAVQSKEGQPGQRGFGGRIFFYGENEKPIKVDGAVSIYVFDDRYAHSDNPAPEKKFVFPKDSLASHYSKCTLGHSYSFWIPLGPVGGPTRNLSLVTRLDGDESGSVVSGLTRKILPGTSPVPIATTPAAPRSANNVQLVQYLDEESVSAKPQPKQSLGDFSQTIDLTPSFAQRLQEIQASATGQDGGLPRDVESVVPASPTPSAEPSPHDESTRSEPSISQAPTTPSLAPAEHLPRRQPHRAEWLSGLPPTPRSGFRNARLMPDRSESELARQAEQYFRAQSQNQAVAPAHPAN